MPGHEPPVVRCLPPPPQAGRAPFFLVRGAGTVGEVRYPFYDHVEIARDDGRAAIAGLLLVNDPSVSRRHCVVVRGPDDRCLVRDLSRNGTRVDGRRIVPNVECELHPGQTLSVSGDVHFVLEGAVVRPAQSPGVFSIDATMPSGALTFATLLVGDIRNYTTLVSQVPTGVLQQSMNRIFEILGDEAGRLGGTVKEFQGDALVAFWEGRGAGAPGAATACHAALALDRRARELAADRSVWQVEGFPLEMDWALATGMVMIDAFGGERRTGLSMVGEPMVLAFRLEKFATDLTGSVLACPVTHKMAGPRFVFRSLGEMQAKGFSKPDLVYALERELP